MHRHSLSVAILVTALGLSPFASAQAVSPRISQSASGNVTELHVTGPNSWGEVTGQLQKLLVDRSRLAGVPAPSAAERDSLPPPLLMERGLRLLAKDRDQGFYLVVLAKMRMRWDGAQCKDRTAPQGATVVQLMVHDAGLDPAPDPGDQARSVATMKRILDEGSIFTGKASPWWLCSNGIDALGAGLHGTALTEDDWRIPPAERAAKRKEFEAAYGVALKTLEAQAAK